MSAVKSHAVIGIILVLQFSALRAEDVDPLVPWRSRVQVEPVVSHTDRHVIHSYFNTCPESPDGRHVVYFTSDAADGESGDIRVLDRRCSDSFTYSKSGDTRRGHLTVARSSRKAILPLI
jgi:hypothetical protein